MTKKQESILVKDSVSLTVGVIVLILSSLYWNNKEPFTTLFFFPQTPIFIILGFLHAYNIGELEGKIRFDEWNIFRYVAYTILYTGWYNIVLLPESGIGYVEWVLLFWVLGSNLISQAWKTIRYDENLDAQIVVPFVGRMPMTLIVFGILLFLMKCIAFYYFSDNLYGAMILGNKTARLLVGCFLILGFVLFILQAFRRISAQFGIKISKEQKDKATSFMSKVFQKMIELVKQLFQIIKAAVSLPALIAIVGAVLFFSCGFTFFIAKGIYDDVLQLVEPILEKLLSTGENKVVPSLSYFGLQTFCLVLVLLYTLYLDKQMRKSLKENLRKKIMDCVYKEYVNEENPETTKLIDVVSSSISSQFMVADQMEFLKNEILLEEKIRSLKSR